MTQLLNVENLSVTFVSAEYKVEAVKNVSFEIKQGETVAIVGESGSGKSVTAMSIMRLHEEHATDYQGTITLEETDILTLSDQQCREIRGRDIAMIFQEPMTSLNPVYPVGEQIYADFIQ